MRTVQRALPSICAILAVLATLGAALGIVEPGSVLWRAILIVATGGVVAVLLCRPSDRRIFAVWFAVVGVAATLRNPIAEAGSLLEADWPSSLLSMGTGLAILAGVLVITRIRRGNLGRRELIDGAIASLGAASVTWVLVVMPALRDDLGPGLMIVASAHLPISIALLALVFDLYLDGLTRNVAMRLVLLAAAINVVSSITRALIDIETIGTGWASAAAATNLAALLLVFAAFGHRSADLISMPAPHHVADFNREAIRVTPFVLSLTAPAALMALVPTTSGVDTVYRIVVTAAGTAALILRLIITSRTISHAQTALRERIHTDELTGLATRSYFLERVAQDLDRTWRTELRPTVIQFNLDRFKNINDGLGHDPAGQVLLTIAHRLDTFAKERGGIAARIGGDEFAILDSSLTSNSEAAERAEEALKVLREPIVVGESTIFITASVGVAVAARNRTVAAETLASQSMIATHRAKAAGRDRVSIFDDSMQAEITHRMDVEHALHGAIGRGELRLYQQPIVDISTGRLSGFESLIRWERAPDLIVSPIDFVPIAEETGLINEIGAWALNEALSQLRRWIDDGIAPPTTTISVNVSPRQIADPQFPSVVRSALTNNRVPAHLLWIEVTESMMIDDPVVSQRTLREVREMGVRIALDDFGTGYSSLSLLQQFPIQRIKIDRAFISGIAERSNDRSLVHTIIAMAQSMGLDLVAEGIETVHQLQTLRELGCDKAQGYLISRPVPAAALPSTIAAIAELAELTMFQPSFDASKPLHRPDEQVASNGAGRRSGTLQRDVVAAGWHPSQPIGRPFI